MGSFTLGLAVISAPYPHPRFFARPLGAFLFLGKIMELNGFKL